MAVRHVPLSAWLYLAGIIGSAFIAGATVSQLPSVRSLVPGLREDRPARSAITPSSLDERIRLLTEAHTWLERAGSTGRSALRCWADQALG